MPQESNNSEAGTTEIKGHQESQVPVLSPHRVHLTDSQNTDGDIKTYMFLPICS